MKETISIEFDDEKLRALEQTLADRRGGCAAQSEALAAFRRCGRIETLTRAMLTELVEEIRVFEGGKIEVRFRFRDAFREILNSDVKMSRSTGRRSSPAPEKPLRLRLLPAAAGGMIGEEPDAR